MCRYECFLRPLAMVLYRSFTSCVLRWQPQHIPHAHDIHMLITIFGYFVILFIHHLIRILHWSPPFAKTHVNVYICYERVPCDLLGKKQQGFAWYMVWNNICFCWYVIFYIEAGLALGSRVVIAGLLKKFCNWCAYCMHKCDIFVGWFPLINNWVVGLNQLLSMWPHFDAYKQLRWHKNDARDSMSISF